LTRLRRTQGSFGVIAILIALGGAKAGPAMARSARIPPAGAVPVSVGSWSDPSYSESVGPRASRPREVGSLGPGDHRVALSESRRLPAGVYLVRLVRGDRVLTDKACVMR
jgi:hypothetical protein